MSYNINTALIFAAGLGTRLKPLTDKVPKALVKIKEKTLLQIAIEKLQDAGFQRIVINAHHFAEQIFDFIKNANWQAEIIISHEKDKLLDTGGGIFFARDLLKNNPFLAYNVDIISNVDLQKLIKSHKSDSLATLLVSKRPTSRYLAFDENNLLAGWKNIKTSQTKTPYNTATIDNCNMLAFNGIHIISPKIFEYMKNWEMPFSIIDLYISICNIEKIYAYEQLNLKIVDVGKPHELNLMQNLNF